MSLNSRDIRHMYPCGFMDELNVMHVFVAYITSVYTDYMYRYTVQPETFAGTLIWRISKYFTLSPKLISPSVSKRIIVHNGACAAHMYLPNYNLPITFLDQFTNFNTRQNNRLYGIVITEMEGDIFVFKLQMKV